MTCSSGEGLEHFQMVQKEVNQESYKATWLTSYLNETVFGFSIWNLSVIGVLNYSQLYCCLSEEANRKLMPKAFVKKYPYTQAIYDASEIFIQKPSDLSCQSTTWSSYKCPSTPKVL